jgi:hypothetical protein
VREVKLNEHLNLVPIKKRRNFCPPFSLRDIFKSNFRDGKAKRFVPILRDGMFVGILWNDNFVLNGKW